MADVATMVKVAGLALDEAHLLATTGGRNEEIAPTIALAQKALAGEEITKVDLDSVSAQLAHKLRDLLGLQGASS